jgi:peptide deformylase
MILPIVTYPSPTLRQKSLPVSSERIASQSFKDWLGFMNDTALAHKAAGLAAIQVGQAERVLLVLNTSTGRYVVCINPEVTGLGGEPAAVQEGCLSFPGVTATVRRAPEAHVRWTDLDGGIIERTVYGFEAQIYQHEIRHLDGRLLIDELPAQYKKEFIARYNKLRR